MPVDSEGLKKILLESDLVPAEKLEKASATAQEQGKPLEDVLVEEDLIADEHLGEIIADLYELPFVNLEKRSIADDVLRVVPELVARKQYVIPFERSADGIKVAVNDPENTEIIQLLKKKTGETILTFYATGNDMRSVLSRYRRGLAAEFDTIIKQHISKADGAKAEDISLVQILSTILEYAYDNNASDVHIEPLEKKTVVRFRIDSVLHDVVSLPKRLHDSLVTRVKILSKLRTDEHRSAQDGKFQKEFEGKVVDIRVSIVPVYDGEKVVMRLLSEKSRQFSLEELGMSKEDLEKVRSNFQKPYGMILATGPTGSGKTTTLYAILKVLNTREVNISTIEDPVEYDMEGVNQIQVNPRTNLTFAHGLRSILRQDPDIIMVGEIRDEETASIAINSAMTGHLVLSTLHTNDAATTLPRLLDMHIEQFLVASTVNVAIGQRLVRRIHQGCIESYTPSPNELQTITRLLGGEEAAKKFALVEKTARLYRGKGCKLCGNTGYSGRVGVFEVLEVSEGIRSLIMQKSSSDVIQAQAVREGMTTMLHDGIRKVLAGKTTLKEVLRVTKE